MKTASRSKRKKGPVVDAVLPEMSAGEESKQAEVAPAPASPAPDLFPQTLAEFTAGRIALCIDASVLGVERQRLPRKQYDVLYTELTDDKYVGVLVGRVMHMGREGADFLTRYDHAYFRRWFGSPQIDVIEGYYLWALGECMGC